jgi:hypothetical protein
MEPLVRLNCVAMASYQQMRAWVLVSLTLLLLPAGAALGQSGQTNSDGQSTQTIEIQREDQSQKQTNSNSKPLPLKPGVPGMGRNHRLILKDGSYQMVRD